MDFDAWEMGFMPVLQSRLGLQGMNQMTIASGGYYLFGKWAVRVTAGSADNAVVRVIEGGVTGASAVGGQLFAYGLSSDPFDAANEVADWITLRQ
jgi:hypothetical protein